MLCAVGGAIGEKEEAGSYLVQSHESESSAPSFLSLDANTDANSNSDADAVSMRSSLCTLHSSFLSLLLSRLTQRKLNLTGYEMEWSIGEASRGVTACGGGGQIMQCHARSWYCYSLQPIEIIDLCLCV